MISSCLTFYACFNAMFAIAATEARVSSRELLQLAIEETVEKQLRTAPEHRDLSASLQESVQKVAMQLGVEHDLQLHIEGTLCGQGLLGRNLESDQLAMLFSDDVTRAIAMEETRWRQFNCEGAVLWNMQGSSARGLMQVLGWWVGRTVPGAWERQIQGGSLGSRKGLNGDQAYNLQIGEAIYAHEYEGAEAQLRAFGPTEEQIQLHALARYHGGAVQGKYWNLQTLRTRGEWVRVRNSTHANYADRVMKHLETRSWERLPECICDTFQ